MLKVTDEISVVNIKEIADNSEYKYTNTQTILIGFQVSWYECWIQVA